MPDVDPASFPGNERFERVAELGRGGMGVVYEVRDKDRQVRLALKSLRRVGPREILRLKAEFRALRDLRHPNLIRLGELFEHDGRWFFTMELLEGADFMRRVRTAEPEAPPTWVPAPSADGGTTETRADGVAARPPGAAPTSVSARGAMSPDEGRRGQGIAIPPLQPSKHRGFDEAKLRASLRGLVTGLAALHRAGMVHRDVKPSNIMIEPDGRVVLLDFGVVADTDAAHNAPDGAPREIVGTYAYMAPEQGVGDGVGAAADWYAVGVILFQALTGHVPFNGNDGLYAKQAVDAPSPRQWVEDLPDDLVAICERLLARDPRARPSEAELLTVFGIRADHLQDSDPGGIGPSGLFLGRDDELAQLDAAFADVADGHGARAVFLTGESGIGKTALARRFLDRLNESRSDVLVLHSRCDEREIVPYNALDGAVDALARFLATLPDEIASPVGARELLRTFPVLSGVGALARAARRAPTLGTIDPRSAAFAALGELLGQIAQRRRIVLVVDDIHWADVDSLGLFGDLLGGDHPPPLMLLATAREVDGKAPAAVAAIRMPAQVIHLGGLRRDDAEALLRATAPGLAAGTLDTARLADEARGHPMFLAELARSLDRHGESGARLDDALWRRIGELADDARALLETVVLAASALPLGTVASAAGLGAEAFARELGGLRAARLVRVTGTRDADTIEPYHDRVRETVAGRLSDERRRDVHRALAQTLEARDGAVEILAYHLAHGGEHARAAGFAEAAARRASASLAFERAAEWLRLALDMSQKPDARITAEHRRALLAERADLLARAGRTMLAADCFLEAAAEPGLDAESGLELRRRAAEELLIGGHTARGLEVSTRLLAELRLPLPRSTPGALARLVWYQTRTAMSRLRWTKRDPSHTPVRQRLRNDLAWSIASGLAMTDTTRGVVFAAQLPLLALPTGDSVRIARAMCAAAMAAAGMGRRRLALRMRDAAHRAAAETDDLAAAQYAAFTDVVVGFYLTNDWGAVIEGCKRAASFGSDERLGHTFANDVIEQHHLWTLLVQGSLDELRRKVPPAIRAAQRIGNRFIEVSLRTFFPMIHLIADRPEDALTDVLDAVGTWQGDGAVMTPFFFALKGRSQIALYRGDLDGAHDAHLERDWDRLRDSMLDRIPIIRAESAQWRAGLEIARTGAARARRDEVMVSRHAAAAAKQLARLRKVRLPAAAILADALGACLLAARGDHERAVPATLRAIESMDRDGQLAAAAAARWRLGGVHRAQAAKFFADEGVARPERIVDVLAPGWPAEPMLTDSASRPAGDS